MADFVFPPGGEDVTVTAPNGITYVWDVVNGRWAIRANNNKVSSICHVGVAAPGSSTEGDLWYDISNLNDKKLYIYVNNTWEQAAPGWQEYQDAAVSDVPIGTIVFWGGTIAKIPTGWEECAGQVATQLVQDLTGRTNIPNLRDYMPAGVGGVFGSTLGNTVDSKLKSHNHTLLRLEPGNTTGDPDDAIGTSSSRYRYWRGNADEDGVSGNQITRHTSSTGDSITAPPVYLGVYIMKVT